MITMTLLGSRYRTFRNRQQVLPWMTLMGLFRGHESEIVRGGSPVRDGSMLAIGHIF